MTRPLVEPGPRRHLRILLGLLFTLAVPGVSPAGYVAESGRIAFVGFHCGSFHFGQGAYNEEWCDEAMGWNMHPHIVTVNADGSSPSPVAGGEYGFDPAWSPDGTRIAFASGGEIFVVSAFGGTPVNLTKHPAYDRSPAWSPDGARLAFASDRDGPLELYVMNADGSGAVRLSQGVGFRWGPAWSPDGARIAFSCEVESGNMDICALDADGTGFVRLTNDPATDFYAAWAPDGASIAFVTGRYQAEHVIALMNSDGSGVRRVGPGIAGAEPAWSPDGARIAFTVSPCASDYVLPCLYSVKPDGTDVRGVYVPGDSAAWRPTGAMGNDPPVGVFTFSCGGVTCTFDASGSWDLDSSITSYAWDFGDGTTGTGATASHVYAAEGNYTVTLTVTDDAGATGTVSQSVTTNDPPHAWFTYACSAHTCLFDASGSSDSDGTVTSYVWDFGDGTTGTGATVSHTFVSGDPAYYLAVTVTLTVTDNAGAQSIFRKYVSFNDPPVASFTSACSGLTCSFDGSGSSDPEGAIRDYSWSFGDGTVASGVTVSHTYLASGTYAVSLRVMDAGAATGVQTKTVTVTRPTLHVGDLDRASTSHGSSWTASATITVDDASHGPVAGATVSGSWNVGGTSSCTTNGSGQCTMSRTGIPRKTGSATFTVADVTHATLGYQPADNHDPDGESNGTSLTVSRP